MYDKMGVFPAKNSGFHYTYDPILRQLRIGVYRYRTWQVSWKTNKIRLAD